MFTPLLGGDDFYGLSFYCDVLFIFSVDVPVKGYVENVVFPEFLFVWSSISFGRMVLRFNYNLKFSILPKSYACNGACVLLVVYCTCVRMEMFSVLPSPQTCKMC